MKTSDEFCHEWNLALNDRNWRLIRDIQADALKWAQAQVIPDGNPANAIAKIEAKIKKLDP